MYLFQNFFSSGTQASFHLIFKTVFLHDAYDGRPIVLKHHRPAACLFVADENLLDGLVEHQAGVNVGEMGGGGNLK